MEQKELSNPTPEQEKIFWEYFGIKQGSRIPIGDNPNAEVYNWYFPDGLTTMKPPELGLTNLFKYAIPKLKGFPTVKIQQLSYGQWLVRINAGKKYVEDDLALALFWAIRAVIEKEKDGQQ